MSKQKTIDEKEKDQLRYAIIEAFSHHEPSSFDNVEREIVKMVKSIRQEVRETLWRES